MNLYRLARTVNTLQAVAHPKRLPRRMKNILIGRLFARAGIFRTLWGGR